MVSLHYVCSLLPLQQLEVIVNFLSPWGRKVSKQKPWQPYFHSPMHLKSSYQINLFKAHIKSLQLQILTSSSYQLSSMPRISQVALFHYRIPYVFWLHWLKLGHLEDKYSKIFLLAFLQCCFSWSVNKTLGHNRWLCHFGIVFHKEKMALHKRNMWQVMKRRASERFFL